MTDTKKSKQTDANEKAPSFEEALKRLEEIAAEMESGSLDLDKMISHYEEGQKLIKLCQTRLTEVERRVEQLVKSEDGEVSAVPFSEEM